MWNRAGKATYETGCWGDSLWLASTAGQFGAQIHLGLFVLCKQIICSINDKKANFKIKDTEEWKSDKNIVLEFLNVHFILLFKIKWKAHFKCVDLLFIYVYDHLKDAWNHLIIPHFLKMFFKQLNILNRFLELYF